MEEEPIRPGASRDPRYFVGRDATTRAAVEAIVRGRDLSLTDPRRLGKTYWLRVFVAAAPGMDAVFVDYEGVTTVEEFLLRTATALRDFQGLAKGTRDRLRGLFANVDVAAGPVSLSTAASTQSPFKVLADTIDAVEAHAERTVVIAMDEVPIAIQSIVRAESPEAAASLLGALRSLRQRTTKVRWILAGSVGFHHVLRLARTTEGVLGDLEVLTLGPLTNEEAGELGRRLLAGIQRDANAEAIARLGQVTSRIPFVMHKVAGILQATGSTSPVDADAVATAFDAFVADRDGSRAVTHLVTRLDEFYSENLALANAVLDHLALAEHPRDIAALGQVVECERNVLVSLLDDLVDDHYLIRGSTGLVWRYDVLRRIWVHRRFLA